jgi:hypothetical protein
MFGPFFIEVPRIRRAYQDNPRTISRPAFREHSGETRAALAPARAARTFFSVMNSSRRVRHFRISFQSVDKTAFQDDIRFMAESR